MFKSCKCEIDKGNFELLIQEKIPLPPAEGLQSY